MEPLEGRALLEEVGHWGWALRLYSLSSLPACSAAPVFPACDRTVVCQLLVPSTMHFLLITTPAPSWWTPSLCNGKLK